MPCQPLLVRLHKFVSLSFRPLCNAAFWIVPDLSYVMRFPSKKVVDENAAESDIPAVETIGAPQHRQTDASLPNEYRHTIKKLSILMPVYNERWTLEEIIDRVLNCPVDLELELIVVDDGSTDGSSEVLETISKKEPRVRAFHHRCNLGKGTAVRTAIEQMTGDVAIIQDTDLEYDPRDYLKLLGPILEGKADAVYGSRFGGHPRRVLLFWHSLANHFLTLVSNIFNDLNLTDMETGYKAVRVDLLKQLRLRARTFTFEPEITCRLAQWGARIYEVRVSYSGRTFQEGKKIRPIDGVKALWEIIRCRFFDTQFTTHSGMYILHSVARAMRYNRWILRQCQDYLGARVLEAGSGIGNLSSLLLDRQRLILVDYDPVYISRLNDRFGQRRNVRTVQADLTCPDDLATLRDEAVDTIFCSNVLEHLELDRQVLRSFHDILEPGGHCIIAVPAGPKLFTGMDAELGHHRRYTPDELQTKMEEAGFEVVFSKRFCRLGSLAWWINGNILRRRQLTPGQMIWFDRLWPITRWLDYCLPVAGMSLVMVGKRTG